MVVVVEHRVTRYELVAADDDHRTAFDVEASEQHVDGDGSGRVDLAAGVAQEDLHLSIMSTAEGVTPIAPIEVSGRGRRQRLRRTLAGLPRRSSNVWSTTRV